MKWSQITSRLKDFIHPSFQKRIQFYITSYRRDRGSEQSDPRDLGRAWVTLDGEEILGYSGKAADGTAQGEISRQTFYEALKNYPDHSIEDSLTSDLVLIRGIAMLDRRLGKRRFGQLDTNGEHAFVQRLYRLRADSE